MICARICRDPCQVVLGRPAACCLAMVGVAVQEVGTLKKISQGGTASTAPGTDRPWNVRLPNMQQECAKGVRLPFPERLWKIRPEMTWITALDVSLAALLQTLFFIFTLRFHIGCTS